MSSFAETLLRIRFEHHMTQEEFAALLGTTKQNISRYESGAVSPKISTAAIIAEKLGITLSELSGDDNFTHGADEPTENQILPPKTVVARTVSGWMDDLPETQRKFIENLVATAIRNFPS